MLAAEKLSASLASNAIARTAADNFLIAVRALFSRRANPVMGQDTGRVTKPRKSASKINGLQGAKTGSTIPLNLLGGYRWPNAVSVDPAVLRTIIRREVGG
jgi:hypothetical protein